MGVFSALLLATEEGGKGGSNSPLIKAAGTGTGAVAGADAELIKAGAVEKVLNPKEISEHNVTIEPRVIVETSSPETDVTTAPPSAFKTTARRELLSEGKSGPKRN